MKPICTLTLVGVAFFSGLLHAQFGPTGTTTISVSVGSEASIRVDTATTTLTTAGTFANYTGTTNLTYRIRTSNPGGNGTITARVTTDFSPAGGPSVASPPTAGDVLEYTCTISAPGTACAGTQTASTAADTSVATFGADAASVSAGNSGSVAWTLTNDPVYDTGTYTAVVTFTIAAT